MGERTRFFLILAIILVLWNTLIIKPLKLFTVFLHELGHAFMAVIFGHGIERIVINPNESGMTLAYAKNGFSSFVIANGGYIGSVFFAILILYFGKSAIKQYVPGVLAIILLAVSVRFSGISFTLLFSAIFAGFVLILYMLKSDKLNSIVLEIVGISSLAYAVYDTFVDTVLIQINGVLNFLSIFRSISLFGFPEGKSYETVSDAVQLSRMTGIPSIFWGVLWLAVSIFATYFFILKKNRKKKRSRI